MALESRTTKSTGKPHVSERGPIKSRISALDGLGFEDLLEVSTQVFRHTEVRCVFRTCISSGEALLANVDAECVAISGRRAVLWPQEFLHDLRLVVGVARAVGPADSATAPATRREV
jgi:hypothetical protein